MNDSWPPTILLAFDSDNFCTRHSSCSAIYVLALPDYPSSTDVACERLKDPSLNGRPVGVRQKQILATSSYEARAHGVGKLCLVSEALRLCPDIILVDGEVHYYFSSAL
jgi:nucleotidyltransferase/DNA polymerase involved in DNA repair